MSVGGVLGTRRQTRDAGCSPLFSVQVINACHFNVAIPFSIYGVEIDQAEEQHYGGVLYE